MYKKPVALFALSLFSIVIATGFATHVSCGDVLTTNTILDSDLLNCPKNGVIIGANNLILDCAGHKITGRGTGVGVGQPPVPLGRNFVTIKNCIIKNFSIGIDRSGTNNTILNNIVADNTREGIIVSNNVRIEHNDVVANRFNGIRINGLTNNIIVSSNIIEGPSDRGVFFTSADNVSFFNNNIRNTTKAIFLERSNKNTITRNYIISNAVGIETGSGGPVSTSNYIFDNFFNNTDNAVDTSTNNWNTTKQPGPNIVGGLFIGGNFWHDYNGLDLDDDGLGDTNLPYNNNNRIRNGGDFLPLVTAPPFDFKWNVTARTITEGDPDDPDDVGDAICDVSGFGSVGETDFDKFIANISQECSNVIPDLIGISDIEKFSITFDSQTHFGDPESDIFLTDKIADIYAWVVNEPEFEVHASKKAAEDLDHPFNYTIFAKGTRSPKQEFTYKITAKGREKYLDVVTISKTETYTKGGTLLRKCDEPGGSFRLSADTGYEITSSNNIENDGKGEYSIDTPQELGPTLLVKINKLCNRGAWLNGWRTLGYQITAEKELWREWSRTQTGSCFLPSCFVQNGQENKLIATYTQGLGSGETDTIPGSEKLDGYELESSNPNVFLLMNDSKLFAGTSFTEPWQDTLMGFDTLNRSEGTKNVTQFFPNAPEDSNNDTVFSVELKVDCIDCPQSALYKDIRGFNGQPDGITEAGQFFGWMDGFDNISNMPLENVLFVSMNATPPVGIIDNITPIQPPVSPPGIALVGQNINFTGHGEPINETIDYRWRSHKVGLISTLQTFLTKILPSANPHHVFFNVKDKTGLWSPLADPSVDSIVVNKPPHAFVRFLEGFENDKGEIFSMVGDPVIFNGFGFDDDGSISNHEWLVNGVSVSNDTITNYIFATTGTHDVTFRVQDDTGTWSDNVTKKITVRRYPVILAHGYLSGPNKMLKLKEFLEENDHEVFLVDLKTPVTADFKFKVPLKDSKTTATIETLTLFYLLLEQTRDLYEGLKEVKAIASSPSIGEVKAKVIEVRGHINEMQPTLQGIKSRINQAGVEKAIDKIINVTENIDGLLEQVEGNLTNVENRIEQAEAIFNFIDQFGGDDFPEFLWKTLVDEFKFNIEVTLSEEFDLTKLSVPVPIPEKAKPVVIPLIKSGAIKIPGSATILSKTVSFSKGDYTGSIDFALMLKDIKPVIDGNDVKLEGRLVISDITFTLDPPTFTAMPGLITLTIPFETKILEGEISVSYEFQVGDYVCSNPEDCMNTDAPPDKKLGNIVATAKSFVGEHYLLGPAGQRMVLPGEDPMEINSDKDIKGEFIFTSGSTDGRISAGAVVNHTTNSSNKTTAHVIAWDKPFGNLCYGRFEMGSVEKREKGDLSNVTHLDDFKNYKWKRPSHPDFGVTWGEPEIKKNGTRYRHTDCVGLIWYANEYNDISTEGGIGTQKVGSNEFFKENEDLYPELLDVTANLTIFAPALGFTPIFDTITLKSGEVKSSEFRDLSSSAVYYIYVKVLGGEKLSSGDQVKLELELFQPCTPDSCPAGTKKIVNMQKNDVEKITQGSNIWTIRANNVTGTNIGKNINKDNYKAHLKEAAVGWKPEHVVMYAGIDNGIPMAVHARNAKYGVVYEPMSISAPIDPPDGPKDSYPEWKGEGAPKNQIKEWRNLKHGSHEEKDPREHPNLIFNVKVTLLHNSSAAIAS